MDKFDRFIVKLELGQGHFGDAVYLGFIIDDENLPALLDAVRVYFFVINNQDFIIYARETPAFMPGRDSAAALAAPVLAPPLNYCYLHIKRNKM